MSRMNSILVLACGAEDDWAGGNHLHSVGAGRQGLPAELSWVWVCECGVGALFQG